MPRSHRMSGRMPDRMSEYMPNVRILCQITCRSECQIECQMECQNVCQIECPMECQNILPDGMSECMSDRLSLGGDHSKKVIFLLCFHVWPFSLFLFFIVQTCFNKHNIILIILVFHLFHFLYLVSLYYPFCHQFSSFFNVSIQT